MKTLFGLLLLCALISCKKDCVVEPEPCGCIWVYDPVCGCNNVTYGSACEARCDGVVEYTEGECED